MSPGLKQFARKGEDQSPGHRDNLAALYRTSAVISRRIDFHPARLPDAHSQIPQGLVILNEIPVLKADSEIPDETGVMNTGGHVAREEHTGGIKPLFPSHTLSMEWPTPRRVCLTYTPPLAVHALNGWHKRQCRSVGAFCALCELESHISAALSSPGKALAPRKFAQNLRSISRSFKLGHQEDSHEYLRQLMDCLHRASLPSQKLPEAQKLTSFVHSIYGGRLRSQVKCHACGYCSNTYDPALDLSLEIHQVPSVARALGRFTQVEVLSGSNRYKCSRCQKAVRADKRFTVDSAPRVLTLHLKRFNHLGRKVDKGVEFRLELDLRPYMSEAGEEHGAVMYELFAVLVHAGRSCHSGHYYCFVRSGAGLWHAMDDTSVRHVSTRTVLQQQAYMLFYLRKGGHGAAHGSAAHPGEAVGAAAPAKGEDRPHAATGAGPAAGTPAGAAANGGRHEPGAKHVSAGTPTAKGSASHPQGPEATAQGKKRKSSDGGAPAGGAPKANAAALVPAERRRDVPAAPSDLAQDATWRKPAAAGVPREDGQGAPAPPQGQERKRRLRDISDVGQVVCRPHVKDSAGEGGGEASRHDGEARRAGTSAEKGRGPAAHKPREKEGSAPPDGALDNRSSLADKPHKGSTRAERSGTVPREEGRDAEGGAEEDKAGVSRGNGRRPADGAAAAPGAGHHAASPKKQRAGRRVSTWLRLFPTRLRWEFLFKELRARHQRGWLGGTPATAAAGAGHGATEPSGEGEGAEGEPRLGDGPPVAPAPPLASAGASGEAATGKERRRKRRKAERAHESAPTGHHKERAGNEAAQHGPAAPGDTAAVVRRNAGDAELRAAATPSRMEPGGKQAELGGGSNAPWHQHNGAADAAGSQQGPPKKLHAFDLSALNKVEQWDGVEGVAEAARTMKKLTWEPSRKQDDWDMEYDRGRTKKVRRKREDADEEGELSAGRKKGNVFQDELDARQGQRGRHAAPRGARGSHKANRSWQDRAARGGRDSD
eukprot:jgi/Mesvir1/17423/Mv08705-RA.2